MHCFPQGGLVVSSAEQEQFLTSLFAPKKWMQKKEVSDSDLSLE